MEARMGAQLVKLRCVFDEQHVPAAGVVYSFSMNVSAFSCSPSPLWTVAKRNAGT